MEKTMENIQALSKENFDAILAKNQKLRGLLEKQIELLNQLDFALLIARYPEKHEALIRKRVKGPLKLWGNANQYDAGILRDLRKHNDHILNNLGD